MLYKCPRWIVLQLLEQCNLKCKMCYEWGKNGAYESKNNSRLHINAIKQIIEACKEYRPYYDLFGGEPLLYKELDEVLEIINFYGSAVDVPTNGTLLAVKAEQLIKNPPNRIWVSLDGPEEINDKQRGKGVYKAAIEGIDSILELRQYSKTKKPLIGVSYIVTKDNYLYIEEFFKNLLEKRNIDHISIEMQLFSTEKQCQEYSKVLERNFKVKRNLYSRGMLWDMEEFKEMDIKELVKQINVIKSLCEQKNVLIINYPKTVELNNYNCYFNGDFQNMTDKIKRCLMPWSYVEITANGDVAPCHTYYDLTFGNVYNNGLLDIWNNAEYQKFRKYMQKSMLPICTACSRYYVYNKKREIIV